MIHKTRARVANRLLLFALVLALVSDASAEWKEKVLYSFQGLPDGSVPAGGVVFDTHGNLYGATTEGGANSCPGIAQCGTVYQLTPPATKGDAWTETVLYIFLGKNHNDGNTPAGGVMIDAAGNLYGTTAYGGAGSCILLGTNVGCGTVYELSPPAQKGGAWRETVLYSFKGDSDGQLPVGDLAFDKQGNLYGATQYGGGYGSCNPSFYQHCGTVFKLSPPKTKGGKWTEKVLYSFRGVKDGEQSGDGANPNGGLVFDSKNALYGTTYFGGDNKTGQCAGGVGGTGCGVVFSLTAPNQVGGKWTEILLHRFDGQDGSNSDAGVVIDGDGDLYGTTYFGPPNGFGLIFELKKPSLGADDTWEETVLHLFNESDGGYPIAGLVFDATGNLYGTTYSADAFSGIVFRLKAPSQGEGSWTFGALYGFKGSPDGAQPAANLIFGKNGNLYSTTQKGGTGACSFYGCGTVFEASP
jgi:hypothetical protein